MMQLKDLKLSQIKVHDVNILSPKFDFEKVNQNKVREVLVQGVQVKSPKWTFWI